MTTQLRPETVVSSRGKQGDATTPRPVYFGHEDAAHLLRLHQRYRATLRLLNRAGHSDLSRARVLDVGCGDGTMLCEYAQWGASPEHLAGIDLRADRIEEAQARVPAANLVCGSGDDLLWADGHFDIVSAFTVFSSVLDDATRKKVASEMIRVLKPGGVILWYDTVRENPHNAKVRAVSTKEIQSLFPGLHLDVQMISFLPHIARRWPIAVLEFVYSLLAALPGCSSHALASLIKE